jgi:hypothetical protein
MIPPLVHRPDAQRPHATFTRPDPPLPPREARSERCARYVIGWIVIAWVVAIGLLVAEVLTSRPWR